MTKPDAFTTIADAESDMRNVKDWALILHEYLSDAEPVGAERQAALVNSP